MRNVITSLRINWVSRERTFPSAGALWDRIETKSGGGAGLSRRFISRMLISHSFSLFLFYIYPRSTVLFLTLVLSRTQRRINRSRSNPFFFLSPSLSSFNLSFPSFPSVRSFVRSFVLSFVRSLSAYRNSPVVETRSDPVKETTDATIRAIRFRRLRLRRVACRVSLGSTA